MRIVLNILERSNRRRASAITPRAFTPPSVCYLPHESLHAFPTGRLAATVRDRQKSAGGSSAPRAGWLRPLSAIKSGLKGTAKRTALALLSGSLFSGRPPKHGLRSLSRAELHPVRLRSADGHHRARSIRFAAPRVAPGRSRPALRTALPKWPEPRGCMSLPIPTSCVIRCMSTWEWGAVTA